MRVCLAALFLLTASCQEPVPDRDLEERENQAEIDLWTSRGVEALASPDGAWPALDAFARGLALDDDNEPLIFGASLALMRTDRYASPESRLTRASALGPLLFWIDYLSAWWELDMELHPGRKRLRSLRPMASGIPRLQVNEAAYDELIETLEILRLHMRSEEDLKVMWPYGCPMFEQGF